ncbi:carboxypeptidase-like regulatory domain-containing protein [Halomonas sp. WWR20]
MGRWILITLGLLLTGCQAIGPGTENESQGPVIEEARPETTRVERKVAFPEREYAQLEKTGRSTLTGRIFITTPSGEVIYGAGETISIAPATTYSAEAAEVALAGGHIEPADPRAREYTHYAKADEQGRFKAQGLPAGIYYVAGSVSQPGSNTQRRIIINQVRIGENQTVQVELSR